MNETLPAAGKMELVEQRLAVGAPPFVAGDLHLHRALMDQLILRAVGADGPDAVHHLPGALVAIQQQGRIGGRKLQVVQPIGAVLQQGRHFSRPQINGEHRHRQFCRQARGHHLALVGRLAEIGVGHPSQRRGAVIRAAGVGVALDERAGAEGFVGVDGDHAGAAREIGELAVLPGVEVDAPQRGEKRIVRRPGVVEVGRLVAHDDRLGRPGDQLLCLQGFKIQHRDAVGRGVGHFFAVGRVAVVVEIKAVGAGLAREPDHAVAGVGVHPTGRRLGGSRCVGVRHVRGESPQTMAASYRSSASFAVMSRAIQMVWRLLGSRFTGQDVSDAFRVSSLSARCKSGGVKAERHGADPNWFAKGMSLP